MKNVRKLIAVILGLALLTGSVAMTAFAATTGTGTEGDPIVCETLADIPATYTLPAEGQLWLRAPVGGEVLTVSDPDGYAQFMHPMTWFYMGTEMDYTNLEPGDVDDICIVNTDAIFPAQITITIGKTDSGEGEGGNAAVGTEANPLVVEPNPMISNGFLMNDKLAAGDPDGVWYSLTAFKDGVLFVDVNCYDDVAYGCDVYTENYQGVASEGNPIITYRVKEGETIRIHKYVEPDLFGDIAAASSFYVSANLVAADDQEPVYIKTPEVKVPVAGGDTINLIDQSRQAVFCGKGLIVTGYTAAIRSTTVTVNGKAYKDVDGDGQIELSVPGDAMSRPVITIENGYKWDVVYTFTAVESAEEGPAVAVSGDFTDDRVVNNDDVVLLLWHTLFPEDYPITANGDLTGDGSVNNDDVVLLLWHTLFPEDYPLT